MASRLINSETLRIRNTDGTCQSGIDRPRVHEVSFVSSLACVHDTHAVIKNVKNED